jgi:hypothetical protein
MIIVVDRDRCTTVVPEALNLAIEAWELVDVDEDVERRQSHAMGRRTMTPVAHLGDRERRAP